MRNLRKSRSLAVFCIIADYPEKEGKILLVQDKDKPKPYFWKCPGGTTKKDESPIQTLKREIREEIYLEIKNPKFISSESIQKSFGVAQPKKNISFYSANYAEGYIKKGHEIREFWFYAPWEILELIEAEQILPKHAEALKKFLKKMTR